MRFDPASYVKKLPKLEKILRSLAPEDSLWIQSNGGQHVQPEHVASVALAIKIGQLVYNGQWKQAR